MPEQYREDQSSVLESVKNFSLLTKEKGERESQPETISIPGPRLRTQWAIQEASVRTVLKGESKFSVGEGEKALKAKGTVQLAITLFIDNVPQAITIIPFIFTTNHETLNVEQKTFILELFSSTLVPQGSSISLGFKAIISKISENGEVEFNISLSSITLLLRYLQRYPLKRR